MCFGSVRIASAYQKAGGVFQSHVVVQYVTVNRCGSNSGCQDNTEKHIPFCAQPFPYIIYFKFNLDIS